MTVKKSDLKPSFILNHVRMYTLVCTNHPTARVYTGRLDGGLAERNRRDFRHASTVVRVGAYATADHCGYEILTDGLRADSRGRFGHVVTALEGPHAHTHTGSSAVLSEQK